MSPQEQLDPLQQQEEQAILDRIDEACLTLLRGIEIEDEYLRLQQQRQFKKNNLFWHGFQYLFWSDIDQDWRIPTHEQFEEISSREENKFIFDYVINKFKAHGESVIAALSSDIPNVRFGPRDAQDADDSRAVIAADNCVELIEKWNRAKSLIINAIFLLITEGFVASYTYNKKDEEFGTTSIRQYDKANSLICQNCGYTHDSAPPADSSTVETPTSNGAEGGAPDQCPQCGGQMSQEEVPVLIGEKLIPKGREVVEVYGCLNVRMPAYVAKQGDAGWLVHYVDADPALFKEAFKEIADEIDSDPGQNYDRIMRQSSLTMDGFQLNIRLATQKRAWLRPWMINRLDHQFDDVKDEIRKRYPHGIYFSAIGEKICERRDESMDKHWSITKAGPSKGIHADPTLQSYVPIQEITNNLINLFVMQVEYGIPTAYADTEVFDFEGQAKQEASPGYTYPVNGRPGQPISEAFYETRTSTLSKETTDLAGMIDADGQFVVGSYPSIFGGPSTSGSKTLGEYEKSRTFALQRLSLMWFFINVWWGETMHKAVLSFIDHQLEDEPITTQNQGSFQTKWIRKADMKGSFDRLDPDVDAEFPVSFGQIQAKLMGLIQLNNPGINEILSAPENAGYVKSALGLKDLKMPMDTQRRKQLREILFLIGFEPQQTADGNIQSTVAVEPDIDVHPIHIEVLTEWLCSDTGQDCKEGNPQGYANCLAHLLEHKQAMAPPPGMMPPPQGAPNGPSPSPAAGV